MLPKLVYRKLKWWIKFFWARLIEFYSLGVKKWVKFVESVYEKRSAPSLRLTKSAWKFRKKWTFLETLRKVKKKCDELREFGFIFIHRKYSRGDQVQIQKEIKPNSF